MELLVCCILPMIVIGLLMIGPMSEAASRQHRQRVKVKQLRKAKRALKR